MDQEMEHKKGSPLGAERRMRKAGWPENLCSLAFPRGTRTMTTGEVSRVQRRLYGAKMGRITPFMLTKVYKVPRDEGVLTVWTIPGCDYYLEHESWAVFPWVILNRKGVYGKVVGRATSLDVACYEVGKRIEQDRRLRVASPMVMVVERREQRA